MTAEGDATPTIAQTKEELRRQKLLTLQKREEMKDALTAKFKDRYRGAAKGPDEVSLCSEAISREVGHFCGRASMTTANLRRLEKKLDNQAKGQPADADAVTEYSVSAMSTGSRPASEHKSTGSRSARGDGPLTRMAAQSLGASGPKPGSLTARGPSDNAYSAKAQPQSMDWSVLDKYATYLHEQDAMRQRAAELEMKAKLRQDLDRQVADAQKRKEREAEDGLKWSAAQKQEYAKFQEKEQEKVSIVREKADREKQERDIQLQFDRAAREKDQENKIQEGQALISKIEGELDQERNRLEKKKREQKEYMQKVREENEVKIAARKDQKNQDRAKDQEMMAQYLARLEAQDEDRAKTLQGRLDRQKALNDRLGSVLAGEVGKAAEEQAKRAERQRAEKEAITAQNELVRDEKKKRLQQDTQNFLIEQMSEKSKEKSAQREQKYQVGQMLQEDTKEYIEAERERTKKKRERNVGHREELEKQIAARVTQKRHAMSESEAAMNKQLLELVSKTMQGVEAQGAVLEEDA